METVEIVTILAQGEDSFHQFKKDVNNAVALSQELVAYSNTGGGKIVVGVAENAEKKAEIIGLSSQDLHRINQLISNAASMNVRPAINPLTEVVTLEGKQLLIIDVPKGINKPYQDNDGVVWVKSGADKRKATSREELQRLFQASGMIHADIMPANGMTVSDLDMPYFKTFFEKRYEESLDEQGVALSQLIANLNLGENGNLNLTGALLFAQRPSNRLPSYIVKAVAFPGDSIADEVYSDSRDITGKLSDIFQQTVNFILSNIRHIQGEQGINSVGQPEIPKLVLEELVANALVHRDYFVSAPVRVMVFSNRIEIISPGHLPNQLTVVNIKAGNSNSRNPVLASFANHVLPYKGMGSGILRALKSYPDIDFIDDRDGNLFKCVINRKGL
jgi:ATP-dependent DNA helicase RecG